MATILSKPDELSLSGNLKPFKVSTSESLNFTLSVGTEILVNETYHPSDGIVEVDVKDVVINALSFVLQYNTSYVQPSIIRMFVASIDGVDYSFRAIRAGISNLADTPSNWLKGNFLTWQPKLKKVTYYTPEWITYFAVIACDIKVKAYFPNNTNETVTLQSCLAGNAYTINMQYAVVSGLFSGKKPMYYEVAAYSGSSQLSYIQKYVVSDQISEDEQWILFENSLGGIDTFRAFGVTDFSGEHTYNSSIIDDVMEEYLIDTERLYTKNTGHLNKYERRWLLDFFPSRAKYIYQENAIHKIAVKESDVAYKSSDRPSSYKFTYCFADINPYLNLIRNEDELPANISIPVPEAPNFTIPPRLAEFPHVLLREGVIFPAFDPNSDDPTTSTLGSISEYIRSLILSDLNGIIQSKPWIDPNAPLHSHSNKLIIDSITQGNIDVLSHLSIIEGRLKSDIDFWSVGEISAYGAGASGGTGASGSLGGLVNVGSWADEIPTVDRVMVQLAGSTHWSSKLISEIAGLDTVALGNYLTTNLYATQSYVTTKVAELVGTAPETLNTLNELATALGNDPNFATSMSTLIGTKWTQDNAKIANWDSAFSNIHSHANKSVIDLLTQDHLNMLSHFSIVEGRIKVDTDLWSTGELSAYGAGTDTGGGSMGSLGGLVNVGSWADEVPVADKVMVRMAGSTHWSGKLLSEIVGLDTSALSTYLSTNKYTTETYVNTKISELVGTSPTTLDTLNELAAALGNDPNFATSISTLIGTKWTQDNAKIGNWDSAYSHISDSVKHITGTERTNWNSAYSALHSHTNKTVLDGVTSELITNWNTAFTNNHTHSNKSIIDNLTQANLDVLAKLSIVDGNLKVDTNLWSTGEVSAYGAGTGTGGGSGLISSVIGSAGLGGSYLDSDLTNTFNAYTINLINNNLTSALGRIGALETSTPNVAWGTATSQYSPLTINSVNRNLSVDGHTHSYLPLTGGALSGWLFINQYFKLNEPTNGFEIFQLDGNGDVGFNLNSNTRTFTINQQNTVTFAQDIKVGNNNLVYHTGNFTPSSYLPLSGGIINSGEERILLLNTSATQSRFFLQLNGVDKTQLGYKDSIGTYLFNQPTNTSFLLSNDGNPYFTTDGALSTKYKIWHAGNDGAGSGLDADLLDGFHNREITARALVRRDFSNIDDAMTPNTDYGVSQWSGWSNPITNGISIGYNVGISVCGVDSTKYGFQLGVTSNASSERLYYKGWSNGTNTGWKGLAFLTDNVASATKLANIRYLWGNAFTGEGDVTGRITFSNYDTHIVMPIGYIGCNIGDSYFWNASNHPIKFGTNDLERVRIAQNGNVLIGTSTDAGYKLDVNGTGRFTSQLYVQSSISADGWLYTSGGYGLYNMTFNAGIGFDTNNMVRTYGTNKFCVFNTESDSIMTYGGIYAVKGVTGIGTGNDYISGAFEARGNGSANTVFPTIGFHQPGLYASSIQLRSGGNFYFYQQGASGYANITAQVGTFSNNVVSDGSGLFAVNVSAGNAIYTNGRIFTGYDATISNSISCSNWFRSNNETGWFNSTYGGGIHMTDSTYVRIYNYKSLWVDNNIVATGEVTAYAASDRRLKENIRPITSALGVIEKMNPVTYNWNSVARGLNPLKGNGTDSGFIAQEIMDILPEHVHSIYGNYLSIDYIKIIPYLVGAIKELTEKLKIYENGKCA